MKLGQHGPCTQPIMKRQSAHLKRGFGRYYCIWVRKLEKWKCVELDLDLIFASIQYLNKECFF